MLGLQVGWLALLGIRASRMSLKSLLAVDVSKIEII